MLIKSLRERFGLEVTVWQPSVCRLDNVTIVREASWEEGRKGWAKEETLENI